MERDAEWRNLLFAGATPNPQSRAPAEPGGQQVWAMHLTRYTQANLR